MEEFELGKLVSCLETSLEIDHIDCDSNQVVSYGDLVHLYKNKHYHQILDLAGTDEARYLEPFTRLFTALALFRLGRHQAALRESAIAVELEIDPVRRAELLWYQSRFLEVLGLLKKAEACRREFDCGKVNSSVLLEVLSHPYEPVMIHQQALEHQKNNQVLPYFSLGKVAVSAWDLVKKCMESFQYKTGNPLGVLFEAQTLFAPHYLYTLFHEEAKVIEKYIDRQLIKYPEIHLGTDFHLLINMLVSNQRSNSTSLLFLAGIMFKIQFARGAIKLAGCEYQEATYYFLWCLNFVQMVEKKLPMYFDRTEYLSELSKRCCVILFTQCVEFGDLNFSASELDLVLSKGSGNISNLTAELLSNKLGTLMVSNAILIERILQMLVQIILVDGIELTRYIPQQLEEMARKLILAVVYRPQDDPRLGDILDRLLWCLLMHGGLHLALIWFFEDIRCWYHARASLAPFSAEPSHHHRLFLNPRLDLCYQQLLAHLVKIQTQLSSEELLHMWDNANGELFLTPKVFSGGENLYMMEKYYQEPAVYSKNHGLEIVGTTVVKKLQNKLKIQTKHIYDRYTLSRTLIELFVASFQEYHQCLPDMAAKICARYIE